MAHEKKNIRVKSDDKTKSIKVESFSLVKQYVDYTWNRLAGITTSEAATRLSRGKGVPSKSDSDISTAIHELVQRIDQFRPMVIWSGKEATPYRNRNVAWQGRLMKIAEYVARDSRPLYLVDAVNKILRSQVQSRIDNIKSSIQPIIDDQKAKKEITPERLSILNSGRLQIKEIKDSYICTPLILAKYLHLQYQDGMAMEVLAQKMEPVVIAKFITEHDGIQWEYLPVKMEAKTYSVRVDEKCNWKTADIARRIEIPYSCPSIVTAMTDKNILADIQNDINVLDEYIAWYPSSGSLNLTSEYQAIYNNFIQKLRTLDLSIETFRPKKDSPKKVIQPIQPTPAAESTSVAIQTKIMRGEQLTEADQLYLIRVKNECPKCGRRLTEHISQIGKQYLSCDNCHYYVPGTFEKPAIDEKYKVGVVRQRP
jgi:ribosomal protein S27AE